MTGVEKADQMDPPAPSPCRFCPYRRDVPSAVWGYEEYEKLRGYDGQTGTQSPWLFQCHVADADSPQRRMCGGWVGCHDVGELLAVRFAVITDRISQETFEVIQQYHSPIPLFGSGAEAADHGQCDMHNPGPRARTAQRRIARIRSDLAQQAD